MRRSFFSFIAGMAATLPLCLGTMAVAQHASRGSFAVGVGKLHKLAMAPGNPLNIGWAQYCVRSDATANLETSFLSTTGQIVGRVYTVDASCTKMVDQLGTVAYTTTGKTDPLCKTKEDVAKMAKDIVAACAASGKCNL